ncbi:MAG: hypothetical protein U1E65_08930 [Myxococcota bacterium]
MNMLNARMAISGGDSAVNAATAFWKALASGQISRAQELSIANLRWFGTALSSSAWSSTMSGFFKDTKVKVEGVRAVSAESLKFAPAERQAELFDGPIKNEQMVLVDLVVGTESVTAAVLVETARGAGARICRVFEPTAYKLLLADLRSALVPAQ